jgi:diphosphomevalonate decarboxylase
MNVKEFTAEAYPNLALIKYWGKKDEELHIPTKSSLSIAFRIFWTKTVLKIYPGEGKVEKIAINGIPDDLKKIQNFFDKIKKFYPEIKKYNYIIESENNFPSGAGFASSASGYAALAKALGKFLNLSEKETAIIARIGSGSATRSVPSGDIVVWKRGFNSDKELSNLEEVSKRSYGETLVQKFEGISIIATILSNKIKKISSREGMKISVSNDDGIYNAYVKTEEKDFKVLEKAILKRDLETVFDITIKSAMRLHGIILSYPNNGIPVFYLYDQSLELAEKFIELIRKEGVIGAYTFDAGPNPFFILQTKDEEIVISMLRKLNVNYYIYRL